ncbi:DUF887-domain-containing protein [Metschnikowia bicuspidata var. bicuspidata NRRL YB-4993]|uniref:DUF887-domain-containing protein n=1 Tax=Metschnikowia bicuspidata var. bicuspidata NRRL YB-4993 TaxID=869754 RepID=A0A1A0HF15_9ASCO|nr:DUF887-domain-containing protein [Metschnikowia bicuspidata var. bicuspidata NRRL YB-4993]OBA22487.1 DUF887-domain-containing protein [Metschnikowia bicuspidata var. bicuspidata NRRL YB-4993]
MIPVFTKDPLAWARPFPANPESHLAAHWHEIVFSTGFYFMLQAASPYLSTRFFGKAYTGLNRKTKLNFDIHVVSMFQCIVSLLILMPAWNHPHFKNRELDPFNSIFGYNAYSGFVCSVTIGYFVWDLFVCVKYISLFGPGFLVHAFAALFVFSCTLRPYAMPWTPAFLVFELSTPFVNINWFASRLPAGTISDRVIAVNGILLIVVFFAVRILWGFYAVSLVAYDMYAVLDQDWKLFPVVILLLNVALDFLNLYWFSKMLAIAKKKISGAKTKEVAVEASKIE